MTFMAKKVFGYEDTMFFVKLKDKTTNSKEVEMWNGHGHTVVPDPEGEAGGKETKDDEDTGNETETKNPIKAAAALSEV